MLGEWVKGLREGTRAWLVEMDAGEVREMAMLDVSGRLLVLGQLLRG